MMPPLLASLLRAAAIPVGWRPDRLTLLLATLSLTAAGFVLIRALLYGGLGLNGPSIEFIALARNILAGNGLTEVFTTGAGELAPFVLRPPLYSLVLLIFGFGVFDPYDVATPVNAALVAITVFAAGHYLRRRLKSQFVWLWAALSLAFSLPVIWIASFAMSEALFVMLVTLALIQCDQFLEEGKTSALIWAAVFSALACQTRYIGLALPAAIGLLLLFQPGVELRLRAGRVIVYSLIVALPMALWAVHVLSAYDVRERLYPAYYSWSNLVADVAAVFAAAQERILLLPLVERVPGAVWAAMAVLPALLAGLLAGILWQSRHRAKWHCRPIAVFGGFALIYAVSVAGAAFSGITWDGFEIRYFVPMWIPALVTAALVLDTMFGMIDRGRDCRDGASRAERGATAVLSALLCLFVAAMLSITALDTVRVKTSGIGYTTPYRTSKSLAYIRDNPIDGVIHSNASYMIYFFTDGKAKYTRILPSPPEGCAVDGRNTGTGGEEQLRCWIEGWSAGEYVLWFYNFHGNSFFDFGPAEMRASPALEPVADLDDGVIFRVKGEWE